MNKRIKNILITILVIFLIAILLLFNKVWFRSGPAVIYSKLDEQALIAFETKHELENLELLSRHALEDIVYVAKDNNFYYLYNEDSVLIEQVDIKKIDLEKMENYGKEILGEQAHCVLSYYHDQPVYIIENKEMIMVFDLSSKKILEMRKGLIPGE